jgi:hypothetical protein
MKSENLHENAQYSTMIKTSSYHLYNTTMQNFLFEFWVSDKSFRYLSIVRCTYIHKSFAQDLVYIVCNETP